MALNKKNARAQFAGVPQTTRPSGHCATSRIVMLPPCLSMSKANVILFNKKKKANTRRAKQTRKQRTRSWPVNRRQAHSELHTCFVSIQETSWGVKAVSCAQRHPGADHTSTQPPGTKQTRQHTRDQKLDISDQKTPESRRHEIQEDTRDRFGAEIAGHTSAKALVSVRPRPHRTTPDDTRQTPDRHQTDDTRRRQTPEDTSYQNTQETKHQKTPEQKTPETRRNQRPEKADNGVGEPLIQKSKTLKYPSL